MGMLQIHSRTLHWNSAEKNEREAGEGKCLYMGR